MNPPPPPPSRLRTTAAPRPAFAVRQLERYPLPMESDYVPAWAAVLAAAGYPAQVVVLDFETYFDADYGLRDLSIPQYILDKRWEVLGLAHLDMHGEYPFADYEARTHFELGEAAVRSYLDYLQATYGPDLSGITVTMQNAPFDASVLALRYGIFPKYVIDTKALAAAWNTRAKTSLADQAKRWNLPAKGETQDFLGCTLRRGRYVIPKGRGKHRKPPEPRPLMTSEQQVALCAYAANDAMRQWELFTILLPRLSNPAVELRIQQHTLELFTKPVLRVDAEHGQRLLDGMEREIDKAIAPTGLTREQVSGDTRFEQELLTALDEAGDLAQKYYKVCKRGMMLALAKDDPERKLLAGHASERVRNLIAARSALDSWPLHIKRVQRIMDIAAVCGGKLPVPLNYWGAHTGRWTGGQKINLQNLPKRGHDLVVGVRGLLIAPPAHTLVIVDLAAIEARVLAWIAGQWDLIEKFAANEEIYCGFAAKVLGRPVRKPIKEGKPGYIKAIEEKHTWARNCIGKIGILGCGYGMGPKEPGSPDKPNYYFADAGLDLAMAEKIVSVYRESHPQITGFWRAIERAFSYTAKYKQPCEMERGLKFHSTADVDVVITLPNGRELHYHQVRVKQESRSEQIAVFNEVERNWGYLWGGTLAENVVQAMSRDVLIEAALRLEDRGFHTAHHVHDELILCVPEAQGKDVLKLAEAELSKTPAWAPRLPLGAEGKVSERYGLH